MEKFKYADVDEHFTTIFKTFKSLEEIREYAKNSKVQGEIIKLIDANKPYNIPGNAIWYTSLFREWNLMKDKLESGDISQPEFDNSYREIIQEEKEYIEGLKKAESKDYNNDFNPEKYMNDDEDYSTYR